jgi:hypothetical protein
VDDSDSDKSLLDDKHLAAIRALVDDLACGRFAELEADGRAGRLTAESIRTTISEYGRTLISLPDEAIGFIDVYVMRDDPNEFALDVELWTREEGRSDLTLSLTSMKEADRYRLAIHDLLVQ